MNTSKIIFFLNLLFFSSISSADVCSGGEKKLANATATASTWANLKGSEGSIKSELKKLVTLGAESAKEKPFSLVSVPKSYLKSSSDQEYCESKLKHTESNPIQFGPKTFSTLEELNSWLGDMSQGKGKEGGVLYEQCDKSCSPQYRYQIQLDKSGEKENYIVTAAIKCGAPRDKDENLYLLELTCG